MNLCYFKQSYITKLYQFGYIPFFRCSKPLFSAVQSNKLNTFLGNNFKTVHNMDIQNAIKDLLSMSSISIRCCVVVFCPYLVILAHNWTYLTICALFTYIRLMVRLHAVPNIKQPDKHFLVIAFQILGIQSVVMNTFWLFI